MPRAPVPSLNASVRPESPAITIWNLSSGPCHAAAPKASTAAACGVPRNDQGAITRIQLLDAAGRTHRWLLQNGPTSAVWSLTGGQVAVLPESALMAPLIPGVELSPFDLLMPYLYWPDFKLTRLDRVRGRPAHTFVFRPPTAFVQAHPEVAAVRAYLDTQFNALMQAESLTKNGAAITTFSLGELKKSASNGC